MLCSNARNYITQELIRNKFCNVKKHYIIGETISKQYLGVSQRPLTLILLKKYRDTNGRRIVIQIGGVYTTFCQEEGILLQKYHDKNGRCIAILFKSIGVRGRFDSPEIKLCNVIIFRGQKINANFFCTKFFEHPSGHGRPRQKSWTSAPKTAFFCGPGDGEKLFDPGSSGRKGQECPQEIRTKKFMFMLFFLP